MSKGARNLATLPVVVLAAIAFVELSAEWGPLAFWGGMAVAIALVGLPCTAFVEQPKYAWPRPRGRRG